KRLFNEDVESGASDLLLLQSRNQGSFINQRAAADVYQVGVRPHFGEALGGEKGARFRGNWRREHHMVCRSENLIKLVGAVHRVNSGHSLLWMLAHREHSHTECGSPGRELAADAAQANDS